MCFRSADKTDHDVIPDEIAKSLRTIWGIELKTHGYVALVNHKAVRNKQYLMDILEKAGVYFDKYGNAEALQALVVNHVVPSILLGGFSPRDGLDGSDLSKWCRELSLTSSGQKSDLIRRIIDYYDQLKETGSLVGAEGDEKELQRCIVVDIRYVLFIMDKYAGAKNLIEEMDIKM